MERHLPVALPFSQFMPVSIGRVLVTSDLTFVRRMFKRSDPQAHALLLVLRHGPVALVIHFCPRSDGSKYSESGLVASDAANHHGVRVDEVHFLGGVEKREIIAGFGADIYFDDQDVHCRPAAEEVPTAIVPYRDTDGTPPT
jgi:hypothetical protein